MSDVAHAPRKPRRQAHERWESLAAAIETHASLLVGQGDLILKKNGANQYWYLRFLMPPDQTGRRRHRALYIGRERDRDLVARVRALLEYYRGPRERLKELAGYVQFAAALERAVRASVQHLGGDAA